ncbi:MAG TPA: amino acid ABC transporter substrate-binding protein [Geminicoccaceae bacterium]|nr:amino acid ABC transporter substrate-binding protein [Geminicoccaceae bacterium]
MAIRWQRLLLGVAGSALLATANHGVGPAWGADPIRIGASLPITGGFAINGQKHKDGYELCVDLINQAGGLLGRPVELIISDNQSTNETAQAQFERLINEDDVDVLFGTFSSKITFPTTSIAEQNKMVYPVPSGVALQIYERGYHYIFNFQPNAAEYVGQSYLWLMKDLVDPAEMPKKAAIVYADDFYANAVVAGMTGKQETIAGTDKVIDLAPGALAEAGIEVVLEQQWPEEGFSDWITLANSVKGSGADMVVGYTASPDEAIQLVRALKTVGYQPETVILGQGTQVEFSEALGDAANGVMIHSAWHPAAQWQGVLAGKPFSNQDFIQAFKDRFGREPDEDEAIPFATCQGMEQAIRATGSTDNQVLRDWLAARTAEEPVKTILGDFHWDDRGLPEGKSFLITQWQDGDLKFVYPVGEFPGTSELLWKKPAW